MKILHINQKNVYGGAAKIAISLVEELNEQHMQAELWYFTKSGNHVCSSQPIYPFLEKLYYSRIFEKIIKKCIRYYTTHRGDVSQPFFRSVINKIYKWNPDVIHLHNLHGGWVDLKTLASLSKDFTIIFTLHDEWILTGHCGSTMGCAGWKSGCLECPFLDRYVQLKRPVTEKSRKEKEKFLNILAKNNSLLVSPSMWLKERIINANIWAGRDIVVIPNGFDLKPFYDLEKDKSKLREELSLPINQTLAFFVADGGSQNNFKGFSVIDDMLNIQNNTGKNFTVVVAGDKLQEREIKTINNITVIKVGYLNRSQLLKYYSAVDLLLYPTRADSFGLVIAEAMASGLPVITTKVDAIPELIQDKITGIFVNKDDPVMLSQAMNDFLKGKYNYSKIGKAAREKVFESYSLKKMVKNYLELYQGTKNEK